MKVIRLATLAAIVLATSVGGCSRNHAADPAGALRNPVAPTSPSDTTPIIPPPQPPAIQPVVFAGWDTTQAGHTGLTRWRLGNDSSAPFLMHWTLASEAGWPGFPIEGTVTLAALSEQLIVVPIAVPTDAAPGMYGLLMTVSRPEGMDYSAEGFMRVVP